MDGKKRSIYNLINIRILCTVYPFHPSIGQTNSRVIGEEEKKTPPPRRLNGQVGRKNSTPEQDLIEFNSLVTNLNQGRKNWRER